MIKVGCASGDITGEIGCPLSGFIFRKNKPSTSVNSPLSVRVLVLDDSGRVFLLVSYEVLGLSSKADTALREAVKQAVDVPVSSECCVLMTTHTHSAPVVYPLEGEPDIDPQYLELLCGQTADTAARAMRKRVPARLYMASKSITDVTYNRRTVLADGSVSMEMAPGGAGIERGDVDDTMSLLVWQEANGSVIASVVHFACHGDAVCTGGIGGDVPGEISRRFEQRFGAPCLFLQGACGDINPRTVSGPYARMVKCVDRVMDQANDLPGLLKPIDTTAIEAVASELPLSYQAFPEREQVLRKIEHLDRIAGGEVDSPAVQETMALLGNIMNVSGSQRVDPEKAAYAAQALAGAERRVLRAIDARNPPPHCPVRLIVWSLGKLVMVFISAELFTHTGRAIRALDDTRCILPVGYAGPMVGYIPTREAMSLGGYEVEDAWRFYRQPGPFAPESEQQVIEAVQSLLTEVSLHK